jgi:hypothetical protein
MLLPRSGRNFDDIFHVLMNDCTRSDWIGFLRKQFGYKRSELSNGLSAVVGELITCNLKRLLQYTSPISMACPGLHDPRLGYHT